MVTVLAVMGFHLLVQLKVFNTEKMNSAVFALMRYEDASQPYKDVDSDEALRRYGLYDMVVAQE